MDKKIRAKFFSRRFSGIQHTIWGRNGKKLEDDLFVDVDPINYEVCRRNLLNLMSKYFETEDLGYRV